MKKLFIAFIFILIFTSILFAQDTLINKPIYTNRFDLSFNYNNKKAFDIGIINNKVDEETYTLSNCQMIIPKTDSTFLIYLESKGNTILYRNVNEISFKGKSYGKTGLLIGGIGGLVTGLVTSYFIYYSKKEDKYILDYYLMTGILTPVFTIGGMIMGWTIGANTYEREYFDITKYLPEKRKDVILNIFMKKQINL